MGQDGKGSSSFKRHASEILEIYETSIEYVGFPQSEMDNVHAFYDRRVVGTENEIKSRIMKLHIDFMGGMNFRNREDPKNTQLQKRLNEEIAAIREILDDL